MARQTYLYNQKQNVKTSLDITEITPVYWNKLYPGESIQNLNFRNISRMITPIYPTLDSPYIDLYAFAVPKRIIQPADSINNPNNNNFNINFSQSFTEFLKKSKTELMKFSTENGIDLTYSPYSYIEKSSLLNKFGINKTNYTAAISLTTIDLNYLFVYKKIYFDFFRQKQLENINYEHWLKKIMYGITKGNNQLDPINAIRNTDIDKSYYSALWWLDKINVCNVDNEILNDITFKQINTDLSNGSIGIMSYTGWNNFKFNMFDKFVNNSKIMGQIDYGTQKDILLKVWNTDNGDKTQAQLIGFEHYDQTIKQVINQAKGENDSSQSLGEVGGMSVVYNEGNIINNFTANEETYIMVLAVPNYKMAIRNYLVPNEWLLPDAIQQSDFNPMVDYIQQPLFTDAFMEDKVVLRNVLGYQKPFSYLRQKPSIVAGEIVNNWKNWTYSIEVDVEKGIGLSLLKAQKKPFKETLISPNQDSFIQEWEFTANVYRTLKPDFIIENDVLEGK